MTAPIDAPFGADRYRDAIGRFASGVSSVSLQPPMLLVCLNQQSATARAITTTRRFAVNILGEQQVELARRCLATRWPRWSADW